MKYAKKKNNRLLPVALLVSGVLLAALIGFVVFMETRGADTPAETTAPEATEAPSPAPGEVETTETTIPVFTEPTQAPTQAAEPDLMVSTPYCSLFYPGSLKEGVRAEGTAAGFGYAVTYYGTVGDSEIVLFAILFAEERDNSFPVGAISHEGITMDVSLVLPDIEPESTWEPEDIERITELQEGVNYLLDTLEKNPAFTAVSQSASKEPTQPAQKPEEPQNGDLKAATPYADLYFPGQWKDSVRWEGRQTQIGYIADFYGIVNGREAKIFTVYFAETVDEAIPVGLLTAADMTMDVSIALWELSADSGWSQAEQDMFHALQEKMNYMLDKLKENPGFSPLDA